MLRDELELTFGDMRMIRVLLVLSLCTPSLLAQSPGWSRGQQLLPLTFDDCVRRAARSLEAETYEVEYSSGAFAAGRKGVHTAVIACNAGPDSKMWVNVFVASNGEGGGLERQRLQAQMEGNAGSPPPPPPPPPTGGGQTINWGDSVRGTIQGCPVGTQKTYTCPPGGGPSNVWGTDTYTHDSSICTAGVHAGLISLRNGGTVTVQVEAGRPAYKGSTRNGIGTSNYESWDCSYSFLGRANSQVPSAPMGGQSRYLTVQLRGHSAVVTWYNAPTGASAWVSVVPAGTADSSHVGKWSYTNATPSGTYESGPLNPGDYEVRFYGDSGYGQILDRLRFRVN